MSGTRLWGIEPGRTEGYYSGEPLRIGLSKQLVFDDAIVEDRIGLVRKLRHPMKLDGVNPVLKPDKPWECGFVYAPKVIYDREQKLFRMWYNSFNHGAYYRMNINTGEMGYSYSLLYAESEDGYNWTKPLFDMFPACGCERTNIVYTGGWLLRDGRQVANLCAGTCIFSDPDEASADRRYKLLYVDRPGICLAYSPDGIHWTGEESNPVIVPRSDTHLNIVYDKTRRVWIMINRPIAFASGLWHQKFFGDTCIKHQRRRIAVAESRDLLHWSKTRTVFVPDEHDLSEFDRMSVIEYQGKLFGIVAKFDGRTDEYQVFRNELVYSNDAYRWERLPDREALILLGDPGAFDSGGIYPPLDVVEAADAYNLLYYAGNLQEHGAGNFMSFAAIGVAAMSKDGFVGQYAGDLGGYLLTKEFLFEGDRLHVSFANYLEKFHWQDIRTYSGALCKAELLEYPNEVIPGFSLDECDPIPANFPDTAVTWRGGDADLSSVRGKAVCLRFHLKNGGLYSFTVSDSK